MTHAEDQLHRSIWLDHGNRLTQPLGADIECDVCVVGAGIAGLLTAYRLAEAGRRVVVIDSQAICGGETGRTTAHVSDAFDDRYVNVERMHGRDGSRLAAESHRAAIENLQQLACSLHVERAFRRVEGYLVVNERHRDRRDELLGLEEAAARRAGVRVHREAKLPAPWPDLGPALRFESQGQLHPTELFLKVAEALVARGGKIYTSTKAKTIRGGHPASVETEAGPVVRCRDIVVATNTPVNDIVTMHTKQAGYQTYVIALRVPKGSLPPLLLWDGLWEDDEMYRYIRLTEFSAEHELLIVGGEDHKTGQGPEGSAPFERLERWTRQHFPMAGAVERRWSGEVMEPADGMGYIGRNPTGAENVYIVTGDSGNGMTHGAVASMLIPDLIQGRDNPWAKLYDPSRKIGLHALRDYASENLNTLAQYGDWLKRGDVASVEEIPAGHGAIVVRGVKHLAVYKDEQGRCTCLNATCTHLGGVVRWNAAERTWDCPCHASRFDRHGRVLHGPANSDLSPEKPT